MNDTAHPWITSTSLNTFLSGIFWDAYKLNIYICWAIVDFENNTDPWSRSPSSHKINQERQIGLWHHKRNN